MRVGCFVERNVAEHGKEHVAAAPSESDEGLVVAFALNTFPVRVARDPRSSSAANCGEEQCAFEDFVPLRRRVVSPDRGA